jgi:hypothetical protein
MEGSQTVRRHITVNSVLHGILLFRMDRAMRVSAYVYSGSSGRVRLCRSSDG